MMAIMGKQPLLPKPKRVIQMLLERMKKNSCSEHKMEKMLGDFPPSTYNVKYVRNSGKNIQHSPDYAEIKPFEPVV